LSVPIIRTERAPITTPAEAICSRPIGTSVCTAATRTGNLCVVVDSVWWPRVLLSIVVLLGLWLVFLAFLVVARSDTGTLRGLPRMLPDTVRLVARVAKDRSIPRSGRLPSWALLTYLAMPFDLAV
jgi:hypothetical protein